MKLTESFINTINAFDATEGTTINLSVLGGDVIEAYSYVIFKLDTNEVLYTSPKFPVSNDIAGISIRQFEISLSAENGIENNNRYSIIPYTYAGATTENNQTQYSVICKGHSSYFECYTKPIINMKYLQEPIGTETTTTSEYADLVNDTMLTSSEPTFKIEFYKNDLNSIARPNDAIFTLYGITQDGNREFISQTNKIYNFQQNDVGTTNENYSAVFEVEGFIVNLNKSGDSYIPKPPEEVPYKNYELEYKITTLGNMILTGEFKRLTCFYQVLTSTSYMVVNNICDKGIIQISCTLTNLQGESNVSPLQYVNDNTAVDLRASSYTDVTEAWVKWQNYFSLQQPYTLRIWGRDFSVGKIAEIIKSNNISNYIRLEYIQEDLEDGNYTFIALYSGQNNINDEPMFPYYIESNKILTSTITSESNLFIGVQEENGLFNLKFKNMDIPPSISFADDSWETINSIAQAGLASENYRVGDEKTITLTDSTTNTTEDVTLQILGFDHDELVGGGKAKMTIGMKNLLATTYKMNELDENNNDTNVGGWDACLMRTITMPMLFNQLPADLQSVIKIVKKDTTVGDTLTTTQTSHDKLFLFSRVEVIPGTSEWDGYKDEGTIYQYWSDNNTADDRIKNRLINGTWTASWWWLRSPLIDSSRNFYGVTSNGYGSYSVALNVEGVCFGFCI